MDEEEGGFEERPGYVAQWHCGSWTVGVVHIPQMGIYLSSNPNTMSSESEGIEWNGLRTVQGAVC